VPRDVHDWASYLQFLEAARSRLPETPYEFSHAAYVGEPDRRYWVFQGNPACYDVVGALRHGELKTWQVNRHKKDIHTGDAVIIWVTGDAPGCYALATVMSEVRAFEEDAKEASYRKQAANTTAMEGVALRIDTNLCDRPVSKADIDGNPTFSDFSVGMQGTNFAATKAHYEAILHLAGSVPKGNGMRYWKISHGRKDFTSEQRKTYLEQHTIHVHRDTKKGQGQAFATILKEADLFYLCHGNDGGIQLLGRISGPPTPSPHGEEWLQRTYDVVLNAVNPSANYTGIKKGWSPNYNSTCMVVPDNELGLFESEILEPYFDKHLVDIQESPRIEPSVPFLPSRNIILYGPPGTGKTYTLRNRYMEHFTERAAALSKQEFAAELVADLAWWQVITLVMLELKTTKVNGILEHPLMQARIERANSRSPRAAVWAHLQMHTKTDCPEVNYTKRYEPLLFSKASNWMWSIDEQLAKEEVPDLVQALEHYRGYKPGHGELIRRYEFTTFHQSCSYEDFVEGIKPEMVEDGMAEAGTDALAYVVKPGILRTIVARALADPKHDYALIIDEISRGNVASIFGELIALIEDDKRQGAPNELRARLPYSRDEFVVPTNLYIIGAMNTADRSVEALDTALRRRFTFIAVPPQPELIERPSNLDVDLQQLLRVINARIEKLLDKDHCIGHSYFMGIAPRSEPLTELRHVFGTKILPLLEEYFYGDPAKIGMVLGERFVRRVDKAVGWANGQWGMVSDEFDGQPVFRIADPVKEEFNDVDFRSVYESV